MLIRYSSAPSGAGKTRAIINEACRIAQSQQVLILQPTKELIHKTVDEELRRQPNPPRHEVFSADDVDGAVTGALLKHFKSPNVPHIVFATQQAFSMLPLVANKGDWQVFVDEVPEVHRHQTHNIPESHSLFTSEVEARPYNSIYTQLVPKSLSRVRELAANRRNDDVYRLFREIFYTLANPNWNCFVNTEQYRRLESGKGDRLDLHSILKPDIFHGFERVFMTAANFEDSMVYKIWTEMGVKFEQNEEFSRKLRFTQHANDDLITILFASNRDWSRRFLDSTRNDRKVLDQVVEAVRALFQDRSFVWAGNTHVDPHVFDGTNSQRLPNKSHGLNGYTDYDIVAFLSALNPHAAHFRFLSSLGISREEVRRAIYHEQGYQSILRTSIRNPDDRREKTIFVVDHDLVAYLKEVFPRARVGKVELDLDPPVESGKHVGRPRKYSLNRDRLAAQRKLAIEKRNLALVSQLGFSSDPVVPSMRDKRGESRAEIGIESYIHLGSQLPFSISHSKARNVNNSQDSWAGTSYGKINSPLPIGYVRNLDIDDLVYFLRSVHERELQSKEDGILICPAVFDPNRVSATKRGLGNILYLRHVWLDFENGELPSDELPKLFPDLRMVVMNSYRHSDEAPRFRVFIPTTHRMSPETYELIYENIAWKLEDSGYHVVRRLQRKNALPLKKRQSGLDWSKRLPTSLFYLPCQAQVRLSSFFHDHNGPSRHPIDPLLWIRNGVVPVQPEAVGVNASPTIELPAAAISEWQSAPEGQGNQAFFILAVKLRGAGLELSSIRTILEQQANAARTSQSRKDRKAQIPFILKALDLPRYRATGIPDQPCDRIAA